MSRRKDACWEIVQCKQCGVERGFPKSARRQFCSDGCSKKFRSGSNHPRWVSARIGICLQCDGDFPRYVVRPAGKAKNRPSYSERKFCSRSCRILYRRNNPYPRDAKIGDTFKWKDGYVYEKVLGRGWLPQHRYIMEGIVGRKLSPLEDVHHKNGNKDDNSPDNLQLLSRSEHRKLHARAEKITLILMTSSKWASVLEEIELEYAIGSASTYCQSGTS